jgi:hypothetical protein
MKPGLRKLVLTSHVIASVGWLGAVAAFLALALAGLTSADEQLVRAAYLGADLTTRFVILPLAMSSLLIGIVQALGTTWGLFRHYWVLIKFLLTVLAMVLLLVHLQPIGYMADVAGHTVPVGDDLRPLKVQLVADAAAAVVVLIVTTILSVYKPRGLTRYGRRKLQRQAG